MAVLGLSLKKRLHHFGVTQTSGGSGGSLLKMPRSQPGLVLIATSPDKIPAATLPNEESLSEGGSPPNKYDMRFLVRPVLYEWNVLLLSVHIEGSYSC